MSFDVKSTSALVLMHKLYTGRVIFFFLVHVRITRVNIW